MDFKPLDGVFCPLCEAERMFSVDEGYGWCDAGRRPSPIPVGNELVALQVKTAHVEEQIDEIIKRLDRQNGSLAKLQEASHRLESDVDFIKSRRTFFCDIGKNLIAQAVWVAGTASLYRLSQN